MYEAALGFKNVDYYLPKFRRFQSGGSRVSWHWGAFFVTFVWLLYRKMWLFAALYFLANWALTLLIGVVSAASPATGGITYLAYLALLFIVIPMYADALYYSHVRGQIRKAGIQSSDPQRQERILLAGGGTSGAIAVVVVLLMGVGLLGILAAVAIPAYQDYTVRAQVVEGLARASEVKIAVSEFYARNGSLCESNTECALPFAESLSSPSVAGVEVGANAVITITYRSAPIAGQTIALTPLAEDDAITWSCREGGTLPAKYRPSSCRP
jgi:Tfp pilus assembly major pilin PilA